MRAPTRCAAVLLGSAVLASSATAGPWTKDLGSYYAKGGADGFYALSWQQAGVNARNEDQFLGQLYSLYGETGLSKGHPVQVAATLPVSVGTLWFVRRDNGTRATGRATVHRFGDLRLRPQVALHPDKPVALAVEVKIPLYAVDSVCDEDPTFKELCPRPGDGQIDLMPMVLAGGSIGNDGFFEVGLGYLYRSEWFLGWDTDFQFQDGLVVNTGGGVWTGPLLSMVKVDGTFAPRNDQTSQQFLRAGPAFLLDVAEGVGLEARGQMDLWAVNTARGVGFGVGLSARR